MTLTRLIIEVGITSLLKQHCLSMRGKDTDLCTIALLAVILEAGIKKTLYQNGKELAETEVNQVDRNKVYRYGFYWDNPLHLEMYRAGLLTKWDFYEDEDEE
jgi:hypothetical protein